MTARNANATLSINDVSERINVTPRTIRKVLRANMTETPGRGARWAIRESDIPALVEMINSHTAKAGVVATFGDKSE
jgi:hypothetical protein